MSQSYTLAMASINANDVLIVDLRTNGRYVDTVRSGVRNPIRLTRTKGGKDYIGWTRQAHVTSGGTGSTQASPAQTAIKIGDKVRASNLYGTGQATNPARTSSITGYVESINNSWRNTYHLEKTKGEKDYLGFARKGHLTKL